MTFGTCYQMWWMAAYVFKGDWFICLWPKYKSTSVACIWLSFMQIMLHPASKLFHITPTFHKKIDDYALWKSRIIQALGIQGIKRASVLRTCTDIMTPTTPGSKESTTDGCKLPAGSWMWRPRLIWDVLTGATREHSSTGFPWVKHYLIL